MEDFLTEKKKMNNSEKLHLVLDELGKFFYLMTFIPKLHILTPPGKKSGILTIFWHISAILEDFLTEKKKMNNIKKLHLVIEDVGKLFYLMNLIPKLHILATRGKKVYFLSFLGTFRPFWRTSLLKLKKVNIMKKLCLVDTYLECGLCFLFLVRKCLKNWKNWPKKVAKKAQK